MPYTDKTHCGAKIHTKDSNPDGKPTFNVKQKLTAPQRNLLKARKVITDRTTNICDSCSTLGLSENFQPTTEEPMEIDGDESFMDMLLSDIKNDLPRVREESLDFEHLRQYQADEWLQRRPRSLISLMSQVCNITDGSSDKDLVKFALVIELIYGCWSPNIVLPVSFLKNLMLHRVTRSKQSVEVASKLTPAGCYMTVSTWVMQEAAFAKKIPDVDIKEVLDNGQVIGKNWKLSPLSTMPSSVLTVHIQIAMGLDCLQWEEILKPKYSWFEKDVTKLMVEAADADILKRFRNEFIKRRILELKVKDDKQVSAMVAERKIFEEKKICDQCKREATKKYIVCRNCGGHLSSKTYSLPEPDPKDEGKSLYENCETIPKVKTKKCNYVCGEPDTTNPNSYETIADSLRNLGHRAGNLPSFWENVRIIFYLIWTYTRGIRTLP